MSERESVPGQPLPPMPESCYPPGATPLPPDVDTVLGIAARLLNAAEMETNLALMERLEKLADSWLGLAGLLLQRDRDAA